MDQEMAETEEDMIKSLYIDVMYEIIDEVTLGLCFEIHRAAKLGSLFLADTDPVYQKEHEIVDIPGVDVFGLVPTKKQVDCICPNCQRNLAASRFAPHLEKCMGMGRNSSRIASRRSQQAAKENEVRSALLENGLKRESDESPDDDNDADWSYYADKRVKRLKKDKRSNSPRRYKNSKVKNGDHHAEKHERSNTPDLSMHSYEFMSIEERKSLLMATCGVISGHTKKMCTKSLRCPQHTDEQRRQVRQYLLGTSGITEDDDQIDIDTYDDGDSQSLRESLQWEAASSNSSPADSNSTTNSSGSKKRPPVKTSSSKSSSKKRKLKLDNGSSSSSSTLIASSQLSSLYDFE